MVCPPALNEDASVTVIAPFCEIPPVAVTERFPEKVVVPPAEPRAAVFPAAAVMELAPVPWTLRVVAAAWEKAAAELTAKFPAVKVALPRVTVPAVVVIVLVPVPLTVKVVPDACEKAPVEVRLRLPVIVEVPPISNTPES